MKESINTAADLRIPISEAIRRLNITKPNTRQPTPEHGIPESRRDAQPEKPTEPLAEAINSLRKEITEIKTTLIPKIQQDIEEVRTSTTTPMLEMKAGIEQLKGMVASLIAMQTTQGPREQAPKRPSPQATVAVMPKRSSRLQDVQ